MHKEGDIQVVRLTQKDSPQVHRPRQVNLGQCLPRAPHNPDQSPKSCLLPGHPPGGPGPRASIQALFICSAEDKKSCSESPGSHWALTHSRRRPEVGRISTPQRFPSKMHLWFTAAD